MEMEVENLRIVTNCGSLKASFDLDLGDFVIRECKLIEGPRGIFVGVPSREFIVAGERRYKNLVLIKEESGLREKINALAEEAYRIGLGAGPQAASGYPGGSPGDDIPF